MVFVWYQSINSSTEFVYGGLWAFHKLKWHVNLKNIDLSWIWSIKPNHTLILLNMQRRISFTNCFFIYFCFKLRYFFPLHLIKFDGKYNELPTIGALDTCRITDFSMTDCQNIFYFISMLLFLIVAYLPLCITLQDNLKSIVYLGNIYAIFRILESYLRLAKFNLCLMEEFIEHPNLKILVQNSSVKVLKVKFPKLVITQILLVKQLYLNSTN